MSGWSFVRVWDSIAEAAPERVAISCGPRVCTFGDFEDRAARLAGHLERAGVTAGDKVAIDLVNRPEYLETFYAALKLGAVPVNVNYRYGVEETRYLLADSEARAVVTEARFAPTVRAAVARLADPPPLVIELESGYEAAVAGDRSTPGRAADGDDLIFLYTGGTTGMPKGVMWRSDDLYVALWQMGRPGTEPPDPLVAITAGKRAGTTLPGCPLMHGTGLFITLSTLSGGGTVVLIDETGLDPIRIWDEIDRNDVAVLTIVGDVFARPLLDALDAGPGRWSLASLRAITSSGVTWSPEVKRGLLNHLPTITLLDSLGASEGLMSRSASRADDAEIAPARFAVNDRVRVLTDDGREVVPGSDEVGMVGVGGRIPLGYYRDPEKTAKTFRTVNGTRYSIPGDYATVDPDGTIKLLGRGSATVNTGGEKVYPEEVELVLRRHDTVDDCVVVGIPDDRFGEMVVAMVVTRGPIKEDTLREHCKAQGLSGYKIPKRVVVLDEMHRAPNGKADYRLLRDLAVSRLGAST
ncbi:MAG: AMP-binding protein [Acidimicrobiia bacterium]|nr:AMP-binding protein [Acidimicrobiia bacterium]